MWKALLWIVCVACLCVAQSVYGQAVSLPPAQSDADYFLRLATPITSRQQFHYERRYFGTNNVIALKEGNSKVLSHYQVTTNSPFYATDKLTRWEFHYQRWRFEFAEGYVSVIHGNTDAAQLWLDAKSKAIDPQRFYQPSASEQKGNWRWLGVSHSFPFSLRQFNGEISLGFRYLLCNRFRDGWLSGSHYGNRLLGEAQFISSHGIDFDAPDGRGFSLDTALSLRWNKWQAVVAVEGLYGQVRWKKLRKVSAFVDTGAFAEDPDGFIHSLPSLIGREDYISVKRTVDRQWLLGIGYHQSRWLLGVAVSERNEGHNWHMYAIRQIGKRQNLTLDLQLPNRVVSFGYHSPNFVMFFSLSHPDPSKSLTLGFQFGFIVQ